MELNLPSFPLRTKDSNGKKLIFDTFRRRWVRLTPEEWVRQNFAHFLVRERNFPSPLMAVEHSIRMNQLDFRADLVIYSKSGSPLAIVECKAPEVKITQQVFDQIVRYNLDLRVSYLIVTNGITHYCCRFNPADLSYQFIPELPTYQELEQAER